jgi:hypothetical protein
MSSERVIQNILCRVEKKEKPQMANKYIGDLKAFATDVKKSAIDDFDLARIFDIRHGVNAYPIIWMLVWLLAIGVLTLSILILQQDGLSSTSYNYTILIATMAAVVVAATTFGAVMRVVYAGQWDFMVSEDPQTRASRGNDVAAVPAGGAAKPVVANSLAQQAEATAAAPAAAAGQVISKPIPSPKEGVVTMDTQPMPVGQPNPLQKANPTGGPQ